VRELEHAIEHAFVLSQGDVIGPTDLPIQTDEDETFGAVEPPTAILSETPASRETYALPYAEAKKRILADFDLAYVREQLRRTGGNVSDAARRSGLDRSNFRRVMRRLRGEE
jgi:two-component system response regulator HydG